MNEVVLGPCGEELCNCAANSRKEDVIPLKPRIKEFLDQLATSVEGVGKLTVDKLPDQRNMLNPMVAAMYGALAADLPPLAKVEDKLIPGPRGQIPIRVYTPKGTGPFPVLVYFHGGAFWMGNLDTEDSICRAIAGMAICVVVSVDYRLAPEHKFPAAIEDCYAATRWVAENASAISGDPACIAVGGQSAGGNMAAVVALMARDRGSPPLVCQVLQWPICNYSFDTQSYRENAEGYMLTKDACVQMWDFYLQTEVDGANPYASPLRAPDLRGLPSALVITAEYCPLRDEEEAYAARLREAGVPVVCIRQEGKIHGDLPFDAEDSSHHQVVAYLLSAFKKR